MNENNLVCDPVMITATKRVAVYHDEFANDPRRDDDYGVSMFPIRVNSRFVTLLPGDDAEIHELLRDVYSDNNWEDDQNDDDKLAAAVKVLFDNNRPWIDKEFSSYRDWVGNYLVWTTPDNHVTGTFLHDYCKTVQQWIDGEVYVVTLEVLRTYVDQDDPERTIARWECEESVGDVYLDSFTDQAILEAAGYTVGEVV
jgi:hypothetical protein